MKIRTDFVTNSSSYSSIEIVIANPLLLEILQKYKDMGVFGNSEENFGIGEGICPVSTTPAISFSYDSNFSCPPYSLDVVLRNLIEVIDEYKELYEAEFDEELYELMKSELNENGEAINGKFEYVLWEYRDDTNDSNSINGEPYYDYVHREERFLFTPNGGVQYESIEEPECD